MSHTNTWMNQRCSYSPCMFNAAASAVCIKYTESANRSLGCRSYHIPWAVVPSEAHRMLIHV